MAFRSTYGNAPNKYDDFGRKIAEVKEKQSSEKET